MKIRKLIITLFALSMPFVMIACGGGDIEEVEGDADSGEMMEEEGEEDDSMLEVEGDAEADDD